MRCSCPAWVQVAWLTPAEIFQPHWGRALANCILKQHDAQTGSSPLDIVEIGAGQGTCALNILVRDLQLAVWA